MWRLVILSWCGVGLWYINEHRGLALFAPRAVWFDAAALSLGDPPWWTQTPFLFKGLRVGTWDRCLDLLATQSGSSHMEARRSHVEPFITQLSEGPFFSTVCCDFLFLQVWKVCLFHCISFLCASPSDSGTEVTMFKDGLGSESKDPSPVSYLLSPRQSLFIPHFLAHKVCSLYGHFLHTHRSNLLIDAIKR